MLACCWEQAQGFPSCCKRHRCGGKPGDGEQSRGFPAEIVSLCSSAGGALDSCELLLAIPEYKSDLPGGGHPSQSDLFVLAKAGQSLAVIMVEGKVAEDFGPTVESWIVDASEGKQQRLDYLREELGLKGRDLSKIRYQLLHRTG